MMTTACCPAAGGRRGASRECVRRAMAGAGAGRWRSVLLALCTTQLPASLMGMGAERARKGGLCH